MLADVTFNHGKDRGLAHILSLLGNGLPEPKRIAKGVYECGHWSFDSLCDQQTNRDFGWAEEERKALSAFNLPYDMTYGVCDSPEEFMERFGPALEASPLKWVVSFVRIRKDEQPSEGGWRWHKWGPYIGKHTTTAEYLYDEPDIEEVFTFSLIHLP